VGIEFEAAKAADREEELQRRAETAAEKLSTGLSSLYYDVLNELEGAVKVKGKDTEAFRIVAFIDDLDRCLPEKAVELLEAMKTFFDLPGYLFVIGVSPKVVEKGIRHRYRFLKAAENEADHGEPAIRPEDYLDKIVQMPLALPPIEGGRKKEYIAALLNKAGDFTADAPLDLMVNCVGDNPRRVKRFVNLLAFTARLAETVKEVVLDDARQPKETNAYKKSIKEHFIPLQYVKWGLVVFCYPEEHTRIKRNWRHLIDLQAAALQPPETMAEDDLEKSKRTGITVIGNLKKDKSTGLTVTGNLKKILTQKPSFPDEEWLVKSFIELNESTLVEIGGQQASRDVVERYIPGDMLEIPAGIFLFGDNKEERTIQEPFELDVFPVTNSQCRAFLVDHSQGSEPRDKEKHQLIDFDSSRVKSKHGKYQVEPGFEEHPVTGVTWYGAKTYSDWRSAKEGGNFRLPTEEEWEKAARGEKGSKYPWGDTFNQEFCNTMESGIGITTPVQQYPGGKSPYGCFDMAGNVWEWTASLYDSRVGSKVVRGGSWLNSSENARCAHRFRGIPEDWYDRLGFRCARTSKK
jgi:formylglycine-generating enzyme required for sulfatase activity